MSDHDEELKAMAYEEADKFLEYCLKNGLIEPTGNDEEFIKTVKGEEYFGVAEWFGN